MQHLRRHDADPVARRRVRGGLGITTRGKQADKAAVEFAEALAREAQRFADEMERKHAAQLANDPDGKAAESDAA